MDIDDLQKISGLDTDDMFGMVFTWPKLIEKIIHQSIDIPSKISVGNKFLEYNNEINLLRSIEEYNKRNLPKIYFNTPFSDRSSSQPKGAMLNFSKDF